MVNRWADIEEAKQGETQMSTTDIEDSRLNISGLIAPMEGQHVLVRRLGGPNQNDDAVYMNNHE